MLFRSRKFGDRKPFGQKRNLDEKGDRKFGDKKPFGQKRNLDEKGDRKFGDRKPFGQKRNLDEKSDRKFGDRKPFGQKGSENKRFGKHGRSNNYKQNEVVEHIHYTPKLKVWLYNKPLGVVTTHKDNEGRKDISSEVLKVINQKHVIAVGRLDVNTEGLLVLTNSGKLADSMMRPENEVERVYKVRCFGRYNMLDQSKINKTAKEGIKIDGVEYKPFNIKYLNENSVDSGNQTLKLKNNLKELSENEEEKDLDLDNKHTNHWFEIKIYEGKNREVRKIFEYFDLKINRLIRTRFGKYSLGKISSGSIHQIV